MVAYSGPISALGTQGATVLVTFSGGIFYSQLTCAELCACMQSIVDSCGCLASKQTV